MSKLIFKEIFYQIPHDGIPEHYVLQYYDGVSEFSKCEYFSSYGEALKYWNELLEGIEND